MKYIGLRKSRLYDVNAEEYDALKAFLLDLGIRCRIVMIDHENGKMRMIVEAENPYKTWIGSPNGKSIADKMMTVAEIINYQS